MYFLFILLIIVMIYILFIKNNDENFEFKPAEQPEINKLTVYKSSDYTDNEKDKFMRTFGTDVFSVYKFLKNDKMKNQLWSYCIIYKNGGIYSEETINDISVFDGEGLVLIVDNNTFMNTLFASPKPNNQVLKYVIDLSIKRIIDNEITDNSKIDYITGSKCFNDGIIQYMSEHDKPVYKNLDQYIKYNSKLITVLSHP